MSGKVKNWVIALLAVALCVGLAVQGSVMSDRLKRMEEGRDGALAQFNEQTEKLNQTKAELEQQTKALNEQLEAAHTELEAVQADRDGAQAELKAAQGELTQAQTDLKAAQGELTRAQTDLKTAQGELTQAQTDLKIAQAERDSAQSILNEARENYQKDMKDAEELKRSLQREKGLRAQARSELVTQKSENRTLQAKIEEYKKEIEYLKQNQKPEPSPTPRPVSAETVESGFLRVTPSGLKAQTDEKGIVLFGDGVTVRVRPLEADGQEMAEMEPWQLANYMRLENGAFRATVLDEGEQLVIKREQEPKALKTGAGCVLCFTAQGSDGDLTCGWAMRVEDGRAAAVYAFAEGEADVEAVLNEVMESLSFI